jgi:hypothetical protein
MPQINLPVLTSQQRAQLQTWVTGLDVWIAEESGKPENNTPIADQDNLTNVEEQTAQREMWQFLLDNDGQRVHTNQFGANWVTVFLQIRESYNNAVEHEYNIEAGNPGLGTMRRSTMRDLCDDIAALHGRSRNRPTLQTRETWVGKGGL